MDIKKVIRNVIAEGPVEVYKKHKKNQEKKKNYKQAEAMLERTESLVTREAAENAVLSEVKKYLLYVCEKDRFYSKEELWQRLRKIAGYLIENEQPLLQQAEAVHEINELLEELFQKYKTANFLREKYIKQLIPEEYDKYRDKPVVKEMLFMQTRTGINLSYELIFNEIRARGEYEPVLIELKRGTTSMFEYYERALILARRLATARACFVHESNNLLGYVDIRKETKIIQLFHACCIFKNIGYGTAGKEGFTTEEKYEEYPEYNKYDLVTVASDEAVKCFSDVMRIDPASGIIQPIGVSRTDVFFDEDYIRNCYEKIHAIIPATKEKKIILYAPTYRGLGKNRIAPTAMDIEKFAEAFSDEYVLVIKQHQTARKVQEIPESVKDKFAFDLTRGYGMNINELMTVADICISDYSSLIFEYSLFERPAISFAFDLEEYEDGRGNYYSLDEGFPGPVLRTNEEVIDYIKHIDERFDKQLVIDYKKRFMHACDGHSTERILEWIENN